MAAAPTLWQTQGRIKYVAVPPHLALIGRPHATLGASFVPQTATQARALVPGVAAVMDGSMFSNCGPTAAALPHETDAAHYIRSTCAKPDYRMVDVARRVDVPTKYPSRGLTVSISPAGVVSVADGATVADGAAVAVQMYPPLVRNGVVVASNGGSNAQQNWRVGMGVTADGRIVFAIGHLDMIAFATDLSAICPNAGYTDGGGSGRVVLADASMVGSSENRRVPLWIGALAPPTGPVTPGTSTPPVVPDASGDLAGPSGTLLVGTQDAGADPLRPATVVMGVAGAAAGVGLIGRYFDWW